MGRHDKEGNRVCGNCYQKFVYSNHKQKVREDSSRRNPIKGLKRIGFQGRLILLDRRIRKGKCSNCGKRIGDPYIDGDGKTAMIKRTNMHHWFYLIIMPWACAVELCVPCHNKKKKVG